MKYRLLASSVAAVMLCAGTAASAQAEGWYSSFTGGAGTIDLSKNTLDAALQPQMSTAVTARAGTLAGYTSTFDDSSGVWAVNVGYQWNRYFAVEIGYLDLGSAVYTAQFTNSDGNAATVDPAYSFGARFENSGPTLAAVGIFPFGDKFEIHGRGGVLFSRSRFTLPVVNTAVTTSTPLTLTSREARERTSDFFVGVGGGWNINQDFTLRADYQRYLDVGDNDTGEADIDVVSLSILFR